jgi:hypothetical protein
MVVQADLASRCVLQHIGNERSPQRNRKMTAQPPRSFSYDGNPKGRRPGHVGRNQLELGNSGAKSAPLLECAKRSTDMPLFANVAVKPSLPRLAFLISWQRIYAAVVARRQEQADIRAAAYVRALPEELVIRLGLTSQDIYMFRTR